MTIRNILKKKNFTHPVATNSVTVKYISNSSVTKFMTMFVNIITLKTEPVQGSNSY